MNQHDKIITLKRGEPDKIMPDGFMKLLTKRLFPVLSLNYIMTVLGFALHQKGHIYQYLVQSHQAYLMGLAVMFWVSIPALIWIFLKNSLMYGHVADAFYKIIAGLMTLTLLLGYILFPETNPYALRFYLVASMPILVMQYWLFIKSALPEFLEYPLTLIGIGTLAFGAFAHLIF